MSALPMYEIGAVALGYVGRVASWRRPAPQYEARYAHSVMVEIQVCSDTDEGVHTPAASVSISGRDALLALRGAIDEALKTTGAQP